MKRGPADIQPYLGLFARYLRDQGLPVTQQRMAVAEAVFSSPDHQSVEDLESELRTRGFRLGKATIYRALDVLVRSELVEEHDFGEGFKRYEHLFDQKPVREHLICTECGKVSEIHSSELVRVQEEAARRQGFQPSRYRLQIYGLCAECQAAGAELRWEGLSCPIESI
jgi:Fur family ferric uptake transcriptional regulator